MGEVIDLNKRRADRSRPAVTQRPAFFFDLGDPFSYLAAERVEKLLGDVEWIPTAGIVLRKSDDLSQAAVRAHAETCAVAMRVPLVWPDRFPGETPAALRAADYATEIGRGVRFALAATRLAFCGGFDLEDPEILAEAAAAAGIGLRDCFHAAGDLGRDQGLRATADGLLSQGITRLPVIKVGGTWFEGDGALAAAASLLRERPAYGIC